MADVHVTDDVAVDRHVLPDDEPGRGERAVFLNWARLDFFSKERIYDDVGHYKICLSRRRGSSPPKRGGAVVIAVVDFASIFVRKLNPDIATSRCAV